MRIVKKEPGFVAGNDSVEIDLLCLLKDFEKEPRIIHAFTLLVRGQRMRHPPKIELL
jgi:hypothetical protein